MRFVLEYLSNIREILYQFFTAITTATTTTPQLTTTTSMEEETSSKLFVEIQSELLQNTDQQFDSIDDAMNSSLQDKVIHASNSNGSTSLDQGSDDRHTTAFISNEQTLIAQVTSNYNNHLLVVSKNIQRYQHSWAILIAFVAIVVSANLEEGVRGFNVLHGSTSLSNDSQRKNFNWMQSDSKEEINFSNENEIEIGMDSMIMEKKLPLMGGNNAARLFHASSINADEEIEMEMDQKPKSGTWRSANYATSNSHDHSDTLGSQVLQSLDDIMDKYSSSNEHDSSKGSMPMMVYSGSFDCYGKEDALGGVEETTDVVYEMIREVGGYIESKSFYKNDYQNRFRHHGNQMKQSIINANVNARIPVDEFDLFLDRLKIFIGYDNIIRFDMNAYDASNDYIDATARADTLDAMNQSLRTILKRSETVRDVLQIQREVSQVTQQIEMHRRHAMSIKHNSKMSSMYITIRQRPSTDKNDVPTSNDVVFDISGTLFHALKSLRHVSILFLNAIVYFLVFLIPVYAFIQLFIKVTRF